VHHDLLPQLEFCHVLEGHKVLGTTSRALLSELDVGDRGGGVGDAKEAGDTGAEGLSGELVLPADRHLTDLQRAVLTHPQTCLLLGRPGDLVLFDSASKHFATNGMGELSAALYHGALTPASVPRLCEDRALLAPFSEAEREGEYVDHLSGAELVQEYTVTGVLDGQGMVGTTELRASLEASAWPRDATPAERKAARARYEDCLRAMDSAIAASKNNAPVPVWEQEKDPWLAPPRISDAHRILYDYRRIM
jgi:hypothetical protein